MSRVEERREEDKEEGRKDEKTTGERRGLLKLCSSDLPTWKLISKRIANFDNPLEESEVDCQKL